LAILPTGFLHPPAVFHGLESHKTYIQTNSSVVSSTETSLRITLARLLCSYLEHFLFLSYLSMQRGYATFNKGKNKKTKKLVFVLVSLLLLGIKVKTDI